MALKKSYCVHHSDRPAIGVCVITKQLICEECSTRYEGVNYSREGLAILRERRAAEGQRKFWPDRVWFIIFLLFSPVFMLALYMALNGAMLWLMRMEG